MRLQRFLVEKEWYAPKLQKKCHDSLVSPPKKNTAQHNMSFRHQKTLPWINGKTNPTWKVQGSNWKLENWTALFSHPPAKNPSQKREVFFGGVVMFGKIYIIGNSFWKSPNFNCPWDFCSRCFLSDHVSHFPIRFPWFHTQRIAAQGPGFKTWQQFLQSYLEVERIR